MFFFHHLFFCESVPKFSDQLILDPALLSQCEGGIGISKFAEALYGASGVSLGYETNFILKNSKILPNLSKEFKYIFFVISDEIHRKNMPTFYCDEWDERLKIDALINIGWTVYAFSEPALLYGFYPIKMQGETVVVDCDYINKWGLIKNEKLAREIAKINNNSGDENSGHWAILGICVDKMTFFRLEG